MKAHFRDRPDGRRFVCARTLVALAVSLNLQSCSLLGPHATPPQMPEVLKVQQPKPEPTKPPSDDVSTLGNRGAKEKELYPASGALYGAGGGSAAERPAKEGKYTLNFDDADLAEVAKVILGDTLKANYVINPKVTGKVSLQTTRALADDELIPTLEMLLRTNGAVLIKEGPLYKIEPDAAATINAPAALLGTNGRLPAGYQLRVVPLRYVSVQEMQKVVEPLMPPKSVVRADETRNLMLLAGTSDELESVIQTIRLFDVDFMRGMSVGLYPLKNVDAQTIAEELDKLLASGGKGPLAGMFRLMPIARLNAIMAVTPQPRYLDEVESWIDRLDRYNTDKSGNMHVYRVQNTDASELAATLGQIFGQGGRSGGQRASLAPGMTGGSIGSSFSGGASSGTQYDQDGDPISSSGGNFGGSSSSLGGGFGSGTTGSGFGQSGSGGLGNTTGGLSGSTGSGLSGTRSGTSGLGGTSGFSSSGGSAFSSGLSGTGGRNRGASVTELGNNARIVADPANNALIIMAKAQDYKDIETVIKELDVMPLQVLIDATIVSITLNDQLKYGLQWLFNHGADGTAALNGSSIKDTALATALGAASGGFSYAFAAQDVKLVLNALSKENLLNVVSSPSLMVLNNRSAIINVGDQIPYPTGSTTFNPGGASTTPTVSNQFTPVQTGVTLKVTPRVNPGGLVYMDIEQNVSDSKETTVGNNTSSFIITNRAIRSLVAVNNGETIALGGLISDSRKNDNLGIPILSQIPWIGALFGSRDNVVERRELVVLITPHVVEKRRDIIEITNEMRRRIGGLYLFHQGSEGISKVPPPIRP